MGGSGSGWVVVSTDLLDDLAARGLVADHTDLEALRARIAAGPLTVYCGFDPTAPSLHVGNLFPLLLLRRFQLSGHRPLPLAGGATGMIGDPSGRSDERNLLDADTLERNVEAIKAQLVRFLDFDAGPTAATLVNNRDWTAPMSVLDFLRDVGKHVTVNAMLAKESVKARVQSESGISYTEFSYMLLQANDYLWLHQHQGCELQVGGSDQWGNITAGIDLVRRVTGAHVHGFTVPLMLRADGAKFGKTADGAVWLDATRTSPYQFHQYFLQTDDRDVERFLLQLTFLPVAEIRELVEAWSAAPQERLAQRRLADELTDLVHGEDARRGAVGAAALLFGGDGDPDAAAFDVLAAEIPTSRVSAAVLGASEPLVELLVEGEACASKGAARRAIDQGSIYVNGDRRGDVTAVGEGDVRHGRWVLLRVGKKQHHLVELT
jgi:tyrosyl-tRNA synthetase